MVLDEGAPEMEMDSVSHRVAVQEFQTMLLTPVERVRQAISDQLSQISAQEVEAIHETILIRNGLFCGRKFQWSGYEVVWFLEEDQIKFYGPCGNLLTTTQVSELVQDETESEYTRSTAYPSRHAA